MATDTKTRELQKTAPARAVSPFDEMDRIFDRFVRRGGMHPWRAEWPAFPDMAIPEMKTPKVDIIDRENEGVVKAEVAGVEKKDLDIPVDEDSVTIKGVTRHEEQEKNSDYYRCEIARGSFSRAVGPPTVVDGARARADFKDGLRTLALPKTEKTRRHSIKVD